MVGKTGLQFIQVIILARLLSPSDFGLMAIVVAMLAFTQIFSDLGVSNAIIHHRNVSHEELSSLYWLNVCAGAVLMFVLMAASSPISTFYEEPLLKPLLKIVAIYFLISALGQQLRVVAEKELRFSVIARIDLVAAFVGFSITVIWVSLSPTVTSIVVGLNASALTRTGMSWLLLANGWRPLLRLHVGEITQFLSFGGYIMARNIVNTIGSQADIIIGGRLLHAPDLGLYSLPRDFSLRLIAVVNPVITRVGFPVMAEAQTDQLLLKKIYLRITRMTASVNCPLYLAMAVFAPEIVLLLFGDQWTESTQLLQVLALWALLRSLVNPAGSLLLAKGRADLAFKWNMLILILVVPVIMVGVQYGTLGLAFSQLILMSALFVPGWYVLIRPMCGVSLWQYSLNVLKPMTASLLASLVAFFSVSLLVEPMPRIIIGLFTGAVAYIAFSMLINKQWIESIRVLLMRRVE